jgi:hypothetical protein
MRQVSNARLAKLVPWYHANRPRCDATTLTESQCVFSAKYVGTQGKETGVYLCKTHADMADFPVKLIQPHAVLLGE